MRRTKSHYRKLITDNPTTAFGLSLAAQAVYASRHGAFDSNDQDEASYREIYLDLKQRHGDALRSAELSAEMDEADLVGEAL